MAAPEDGENVFDVILGTYEEFLLGYSLQKGNDGQFKLHQFFTNHSHIGSVRCAASGGKFVASGGTDETIRLFNMRSRSEMGTLMQHEGTVTSLEFYKSSHLFSASDDKTICVWSTGSWQCLKTLRGHKAEVLSLAVHPSGNLLLSVSKDKTLRTWNLVKGRNAYITNIKAVADFVQWSPGGIYFVVGVGNTLDVYSTEKAGKVHSIDFGKRVRAVTFITDDVVLLAGDGGNVELHNVKRKCVYHMFAAHANRVKAMRIVKVPGATAEAAAATFLVTAGSDGSVRVWDMDVDELDANPRLLCEVRCGCRITCMAIHSIHEDDDGFRKVKRKKKKKNETEVNVQAEDGEIEAGGDEGALQGESANYETKQDADVNIAKRLSFGQVKSNSEEEPNDEEGAEIVADESEGEEGIENASDGIENEDEPDVDKEANRSQGRTKQKARKRKKSQKQGALSDAKKVKVATDTFSVQKKQADDKSLTKSARKRKRRAGKFKKQE